MPHEPAPRPKTHDEKLREKLNEIAVEVVGSGFDAIDQLAEAGKNALKKAIIRGISPPRKK